MRKFDEHGIPPVPDELVKAVASGSCVLFAGAGVSRGRIVSAEGEKEQYLPTWENLLINMADRAFKLTCISNSEHNQLRKCAKEGKHLFVAETLQKILDPNNFDDILDEIFRNPDLRTTDRHKIITEIPFAAIMTTNYDKLIEEAYAVALKGVPPVYTFKEVSNILSSLTNKRFFIIKLHGDIDRKETVILSERGYRNIIYREPGYRTLLSAIFITRTVLFVGTRLADPDIKLFLESISESFAGKGPTHFALMPEGDVENLEVAHWRDFFGIHLLRYKATKGHPEIDVFLENLRDKVNNLKRSAE